MALPIEFLALTHIRQLEEIRNSKVLIVAASHLEIEMLPMLYEQLKKIGKVERLDVVIQCRGGVINGARRIALLLREFTKHLGFIVPHYCESSSTILTLAADEIIAGDLAIFSPIDPHLNGSNGAGDEAVSTFSSMDIKMFGAMCETWFDCDAQEAKKESLALLCNSIFPPSLTAFYRSTLELEQIAEELLLSTSSARNQTARKKIIEQLMFAYHSHNYAITAQELTEIGLNVRRDSRVEELGWAISKTLQKLIGGSLRGHVDEPWNDVLLASTEGVVIRQKKNDGFMPLWSNGIIL